MSDSDEEKKKLLSDVKKETSDEEADGTPSHERHSVSSLEPSSQSVPRSPLSIPQQHPLHCDPQPFLSDSSVSTRQAHLDCNVAHYQSSEKKVHHEPSEVENSQDDTSNSDNVELFSKELNAPVHIYNNPLDQLLRTILSVVHLSHQLL